MKEILIGGALLVGLSVTLLELFPGQDEIVASASSSPGPTSRITTTTGPSPESGSSVTSPRAAQARGNASMPTAPSQSIEPSDELTERDPDSVQIQADLFRAIVKPPPPPVKQPVQVVVPTVPKPPFAFMGTVIQDTERQAIILNGEQVSILKRGDTLGGFQIESIDERNLALIHQLSATKVLLAARAIQ